MSETERFLQLLDKLPDWVAKLYCVATTVARGDDALNNHSRYVASVVLDVLNDIEDTRSRLTPR